MTYSIISIISIIIVIIIIISIIITIITSQAESVEETLRFLQKDMALKVFKEPGYEAENGDAPPLVRTPVKPKGVMPWQV